MLYGFIVDGLHPPYLNLGIEDFSSMHEHGDERVVEAA